MSEPVLNLEGIRKTFVGPRGQVTALDGVSIAVQPGEFIALHGPSGCGKSTLLLIAGSLLSPGDGTVNINGEAPYGMSSESRTRFRARHIGFVFQQFHLVPYLSVLDNVLISTMDLPVNGSVDRAKALLQKFGLSDRLDHVPSALSVGEQQRAALARALIHEPRLILADEPTGNLDAENAELVLNALAECAGEGRAVLMVTHDERAKARAGRAIEMRDGRLVE